MIADAEQGGPMSGRLHECMHACELLQNRRGKLSGKRDTRAAYVLTKVKRNPAVEGSRARRLFLLALFPVSTIIRYICIVCSTHITRCVWYSTRGSGEGAAYVY